MNETPQKSDKDEKKTSPSEEQTPDLESSEQDTPGETNYVRNMIEAFGGPETMAKLANIAPSTIRSWRQRGRMPEERMEELETLAEEKGIALPEKPEPSEQGRTVLSAKKARSAKNGKAGIFFLGFALALIVLAAGVGGAIYTRDYWLAYVDQMPSIEEGESLAGKVAALEDRLQTLQNETGPANGVDDSLASLQQRINELAQNQSELRSLNQGLESELEGLQESSNRIDEENVSATLTTLREQISSLQNQDRVTPDDLVEMRAQLLAAEQRFQDLRADLEESYESELQVLARQSQSLAAYLALAGVRAGLNEGRAYANFMPALTQPGLNIDQSVLSYLQDHANGDYQTLGELRTSFADLAPQLVAVTMQERHGKWWGGILRRVSQTFSLRPVGLVEGNTAEDIVARTEYWLDEGNLARAIEEAKGLSGQAGELADDWLQKAQTRLQLELRVEQTMADLLTRFPKPQSPTDQKGG